jgi:hypothetical protein
MPVRTQFTITHQHLALAPRMNVGWCGDEYGAPEIDPKRPYGNSDVEGDIREILGIEGETEGGLRELHEQMQTVLQIALATGTFEAGDYERDPYEYRSWRSVAASTGREG